MSQGFQKLQEAINGQSKGHVVALVFHHGESTRARMGESYLRSA